MPAITSLTISAAAPWARALAALAGRAGRGLKRIAERIKNRRDAMRLVDLDDRMLADIGITRSDLRDAYSGSPWRDPSELLARRATERRVRSRRTELTCAVAAPQADGAVRLAAGHLLPAGQPSGALPDLSS